MLALVGNSPSSGSTLLAHLLDSTRYSACGAEIKIFANKKLYNFDQYKKNIRISSIDHSTHSFRNLVNFHRLSSYNLDVVSYQKMVQSSADLDDFTKKFTSHFLSWRKKDIEGIVFEKTPANINCIKEFLTYFKNSYFIHIVRNPLYIYPSLIRRGYPNYIAMSCWLVNVAKYIKYKCEPRIIQIKYEDLVQDPFKVVKNILVKTTGLKTFTEKDIEDGYNNNAYRKVESIKHKTWTVNDYGSIKSANRSLGEDVLKKQAALLYLKINQSYADQFDIAAVSFIDALEEFGYTAEVLDQLKKFDPKKELPRKEIKDYLRLGLKWEEDVRHREASMFQSSVYLNPLELI